MYVSFILSPAVNALLAIYEKTNSSNKIQFNMQLTIMNTIE